MTQPDKPQDTDFSDREHAVISQIIRAEKTLPDEFWAVGIMQEMACLIARCQDQMSDDDCAVLIGAAAWIVRQGRDETMAGIQAMIALRNAGLGQSR